MSIDSAETFNEGLASSYEIMEQELTASVNSVRAQIEAKYALLRPKRELFLSANENAEQ